MAKKPSGGFGSWPPKPARSVRQRSSIAPPKDQPAPRNPVIEQALCSAIRNGVLAELLYEDDVHSRSFAPYVVYRTSTGKVCVFGMQVNPSSPSSRNDPHIFEVGRIRHVNLTTTHFNRDARFDLSNARYRDRICPL